MFESKESIVLSKEDVRDSWKMMDITMLSLNRFKVKIDSRNPNIYYLQPRSVLENSDVREGLKYSKSFNVFKYLKNERRWVPKIYDREISEAIEKVINCPLEDVPLYMGIDVAKNIAHHRLEVGG